MHEILFVQASDSGKPDLSKEDKRCRLSLSMVDHAVPLGRKVMSSNMTA